MPDYCRKICLTILFFLGVLLFTSHQQHSSIGKDDNLNNSTVAFDNVRMVLTDTADHLSVNFFGNWTDIYIDGRVQTILVQENNLTQKTLASWGIELQGQDRIEPIQGSNSKWQVVRVEHLEKTYRENVKAGSRIIQDPTLPTGYYAQVIPGREGIIEKTYLATRENGEEKSRRLISEKVVLEPIQALAVQGIGSNTSSPDSSETRNMLMASRGNSGAMRIKQTFKAVSTAYTHTGNRTAVGIMPRVGTAAVDPKVIPLGTKMWIEGYGLAIAADTGGVIKGKIIDVFFETHWECIQWGRKEITVHILED